MIERTLRKGDQISEKDGLVYTVISDESDGGKVRAMLTEQPEAGYNSRGDKYWEGPYKMSGDTIRSRFSFVKEGPAKRPNNRVTKIRAGSVRLSEKVRVDGLEVMVESLEFGRKDVTICYMEDGERKSVSVDMEEQVEVLGKRGRQLPSVVHYSSYRGRDHEGVVYVNRNWRPGFGSGACGVVTNIRVVTSDPSLVTCTQACMEKARQDAWRRKA
jgi:hypothetical protein